MNTTIFLAQIWGPIILAVGLGVFLSRNYYIKIYRDLESDVLAVLVFGMVAMAGGIVHVMSHNIWGSFTESLISFLGWALLVKGAMFIVIPNFVNKAGDFFADRKIIPIAGILTLIGGIYLTWFAYFGF